MRSNLKIWHINCLHNNPENSRLDGRILKAYMSAPFFVLLPAENILPSFSTNCKSPQS